MRAISPLCLDMKCSVITGPLTIYSLGPLKGEQELKKELKRHLLNSVSTDCFAIFKFFSPNILKLFIHT